MKFCAANFVFDLIISCSCNLLDCIEILKRSVLVLQFEVDEKARSFSDSSSYQEIIVRRLQDSTSGDYGNEELVNLLQVLQSLDASVAGHHKQLVGNVYTS